MDVVHQDDIIRIDSVSQLQTDGRFIRKLVYLAAPYITGVVFALVEDVVQ
jgi:hypothetical protein